MWLGEEAEDVVVVLDTQRLSRLLQCDREVSGPEPSHSCPKTCPQDVV
jgi:hypothetical protein